MCQFFVNLESRDDCSQVRGMHIMTKNMSDVVVIGGGAAGLSAALTLARARRRVTVVDAGDPRNAPATAAHGLLGLDGVNPFELLSKGRTEVETYGGNIIRAQVIEASATLDGFVLTLENGKILHGRVLVIASGVVDELPQIPGLRERWGRDVVHCPYCHGWEIRDKKIGLLATGPMSALQALLFRQWSDQMYFFPQGFEFSDTDMKKLAAVGVEVVRGDVVGVEAEADQLSGVRLRDGGLVELDALAVPTRTVARVDGLAGLGLKMTENPMGLSMVADTTGLTSVPGVWVAGNAVGPAMQVSEAAANGARVAMTINTELVFQDADRAVADTVTRNGEV